MIITYSLLCNCDLSSEVPSLSTSFWIVATVEPSKQLIHNKFWLDKRKQITQITKKDFISWLKVLS